MYDFTSGDFLKKQTVVYDMASWGELVKQPTEEVTIAGSRYRVVSDIHYTGRHYNIRTRLIELVERTKLFGGSETICGDSVAVDSVGISADDVSEEIEEHIDSLVERETNLVEARERDFEVTVSVVDDE